MRLLTVLFIASISFAKTSTITVYVDNVAGLSPKLLEHTHKEVRNLFESADVKVNWIECTPGECAHSMPDGYLLRFQQYRDFAPSVDWLGHTYLISRESFVCVSAVKASADRRAVDEYALLGFTAVHELVHAILGVDEHFGDGLMADHVMHDENFLLRNNLVRFTKAERQRIQNKLSILY